MAVEFCIISIGALSHNRLWGEQRAVRTSHATTTLVTEGKRRILVDPSLPATALAARFNERTGLMPPDVTDVFCTTLRPVHRRSVEMFPQATWWAHDIEIQWQRAQLEGRLDSADRLSVEEARQIRADLEVIGRFQPAPDKFAEQISLYPLAGPTPGSTGLLLTPQTCTIAIAGDAVLTGEHAQRGQVWEGCLDTDAAMDSLKDLLEIAEIIVPGHDNVVVTSRQSMF